MIMLLAGLNAFTVRIDMSDISPEERTCIELLASHHPGLIRQSLSDPSAQEVPLVLTALGGSSLLPILRKRNTLEPLEQHRL